MIKDKFKAVWLSHTSISDFLSCPRSYFLRNVYKDPHTNHKLQIITPSLALGQAVHEVLEGLSTIPTTDRFLQPLVQKFSDNWKVKYGQKKGGFSSKEQEMEYFNRGLRMLERVERVRTPLDRLSVKIKQDLPYFWISQEEDLILCGKIDWLEYLSETDSVHIVDFKTGKNEEKVDSLQLPIYLLLVANCQHRHVSKLSYWYLGFSDELTDKVLPDLESAAQRILSIGRKVKLARQLKLFKCPKGESMCHFCRPFERVIKGEAELVNSDRRYDIYAFFDQSVDRESEIL